MKLTKSQQFFFCGSKGSVETTTASQLATGKQANIKKKKNIKK